MHAILNKQEHVNAKLSMRRWCIAASAAFGTYGSLAAGAGIDLGALGELSGDARANRSHKTRVRKVAARLLL